MSNKILATFVLPASIFVIGCSLSERSLMEQADAAFREGDWAKTIALCEQQLGTETADADAILLRGRAHLGNGDFEKAVADYTEVIRLRPTDPESYYHREIAYRELGKTELADNDGAKAREHDVTYEQARAFSEANFHSSPIAELINTVGSDEPREKKKSLFDERPSLSEKDVNDLFPDRQLPEAASAAETEPRTFLRKPELPNIATLKNSESGETAADVNSLMPKTGQGALPIDKDLSVDIPADDPPETPPSELSPEQPSVPVVPRITTSLPTLPGGQYFVPNAPSLGVGSTGLATSRTALGTTGTLNGAYGGTNRQFGLPNTPTTPSAPTTGFVQPQTNLSTGQPIQTFVPTGQVGQFHANPIFIPGQAAPAAANASQPSAGASYPRSPYPGQAGAGLRKQQPGAAGGAIPSRPAAGKPVSPTFSTALPQSVLQRKLSPPLGQQNTIGKPRTP